MMRNILARITLVIGTLLGIFLVAAGTVIPHAHAQSSNSYTSYLTPFPQGDAYKTLVIGDWLAAGLLGGLNEVFDGDRRLLAREKHFEFRGLLRGDWQSNVRDLKAELASETYNIAIVLLGAYDRVSLRANGQRMPLGSDGWKKVYSSRLQAVMQTLKSSGVGVYWVGLPIMRGENRNRGVRIINEILRRQAYRFGFRYIDIFRSTAGDDGEYDDYGPDLSGRSRLLRYKDGVHFTRSGYAKLAHFVERPLRRDLDQAKGERDTPLLGDAVQQKRIRPVRSAVGNGRNGAGAAERGASRSSKGSKAGKVQIALSGRGVGREDGSTLVMDEKLPNGRKRRVNIKLIRPAIPDSVIAVLTRGQSAEKPSRVGLTLSDQLPNGLVILRSVTPGAAGPNRRGGGVPATELPFFRALVKGERLASVAGRADDFRWPRDDFVPTPPIVIRAPAAKKPSRSLSWDPSIPPLPPRRPIKLRQNAG